MRISIDFSTPAELCEQLEGLVAAFGGQSGIDTVVDAAIGLVEATADAPQAGAPKKRGRKSAAEKAALALAVEPEEKSRIDVAQLKSETAEAPAPVPLASPTPSPTSLPTATKEQVREALTLVVTKLGQDAGMQKAAQIFTQFGCPKTSITCLNEAQYGPFVAACKAAVA